MTKQIDFTLTLSDTEAKIAKYLDHIRADYTGPALTRSTEDSAGRDEMNAQFVASLRVEILTKYYRVWAGKSAHSFIVRATGDKFIAGDILKAATWKAPAKNFSRGNINDGNFMRISWSGVN
jgi:hypothetical protein